MRNSTKTFAAVVMIAVMLSSIAMANQDTFNGKPILEGTWRGEFTKYVAGEIAVQFRDSGIDGNSYAQRVGGTLIRGVEDDGFAIIEVADDADVFSICEELYADPMVEWAEPNFIHTLGIWDPWDEYYQDGHQWSLRNLGQYPPDGVPDADINTNWAWDYNHGDASVVLAILDTGIDMDTASMILGHVDLNESGRIILGLDAVGDGYGVADLHGHGTHVAGIAAAHTDNYSQGIAGVAGDCKILVIQVFTAGGSATSTSVRDGINYAVAYQQSHPTERVVMNYSGGGGSYSANTYSALENAEIADVPFVTISHNDYSSTCRYPCQHSSDLDNVICVGATDHRDRKSGYSNYCSDVNVVAPGGYGSTSNEDDIYSCLPPNSYAYKAGTSMAAPHVTGICGLVLSHSPSMTSLQLRTLLEQTADDEVGTLADDPQGYDTKHGYGRANAWSALMHTYTTPYMGPNQRLSNTYASSSQEKYYRLAPPADGKWEIVATRPHAGVDINCRWIDVDGSTTLASSILGSENVDFVLAHDRPTTGSDMYARIYNWSGTGKYSAEYQTPAESYIGSMFWDDYEWESSHVVEMFEVYLLNGHYYKYEVDVISGEVDVGIALIGPAPAGAYYTNRASAIFDVDNNGSGLSEGYGITSLSGLTGWYAFVVYSTNGRNGVMDIRVMEEIINNSGPVLSEMNNVTVSDGYFMTSAGMSVSTMGVVGVMSNPGNNYNLRVYSNDSFSGTQLTSSTYTTGYVDFILYENPTIPFTWIYPKVEAYSITPGTSGYTVLEELNDDSLLIGTNGPYSFDSEHFIRAFDVYMVNNTGYQITADITSGNLDIGIGLFRRDADYKGRGSYFRYDYTGGPGVDEYITWECDATAHYTLVAWSRDGVPGTYNIDIELTPPNLVTTVATGWDYEIVPRNVSGALYNDCHVTATLPGNTTNTYLNFTCKNDAANPVPTTTFYNQLYLDGEFFFERPRSTGLSGGSTLYHINWQSTNIIKGGKHTFKLWLDGTDTIEESSETDNWVWRQFVWSPMTLTNGQPTVIATPPPSTWLYPQPDMDGFEYTRTGSYAYAIATCALTNVDIDMRLYDDYVGSVQGFDSLRSSNYWGGDYTELIVGTYTNVASTVYPGVLEHDPLSINYNYVVEAIDATGRVLVPSTDISRIDTIGNNRLVNVYEAYLIAGTDYTITVDNMSGTADLELILFGPDYGYYHAFDHTAISYNVGPDEEITYTATATAYYVVAVYKRDSESVYPQNVYELTIVVTPPNLTYDTPAGWSYPVVPRNTFGADTNNCVLTTTLPGNTNSTYFNYHCTNDGPIPTSGTYWNYVYIDGQGWYGEQGLNPLYPGGYSWHMDRQSSNVLRGGRHALAVNIDRFDDIEETDETDNWYEHQFIWSPYVLSDYTAVTRSIPPILGSATYPNCDGFEFTRGYWGAVGMLPYVNTDNYDLRLHQQWTNSLNGFGYTLKQSNEDPGLSDFVMANWTTPYGNTFDAGVIRVSGDPATGQFVIQQANEMSTINTPGTYGPYIISANQVLALVEVYLVGPGTYDFEVDVVSGDANIGTSLYTSTISHHEKGDYFTGGYSNSAGGGGDESFSIVNPSASTYYAWVVWKNNAYDRNRTSTFYLTWGPSGVTVPAMIDDLVIERVDSTSARLIWNPVTEDTSGSPITVDYYRIHRSTDPYFVPSPSDSIGMTNDTTYLDSWVVWYNEKYFYKVISVVSTDMVTASDDDVVAPRAVVRENRSDGQEAVQHRERR